MRKLLPFTSGVALLIGLPVALRAQSPHPNVLVSTQNTPSETAIAINPKNPQQLIAGANLNNQYSSLDGGQTWTWRTLTSPYSVWGDPVVVADTTGAFYYFHLSNPGATTIAFPFIDRLVVQRAASAATPFNYRSFFAYNPPKQQDKEWVAVDRRTNALYVTWTEFDTYGSLGSQDSSRILFSRSTDQAQTWSTPRRISFYGGDAVDEDATVEGAVPAVGPNGEVYVAWAGPRGIVFNRSLDGGQTWLPRERTIVNQPGGWEQAVPGIYRANGLPVTVCDVSPGPTRGNLYVNWTDQRNGPTDTDVWLARSADGGQTWSAPIRVNNDPPGRHQFFTWMTVDQVTGHLWCVFYDRRNNSSALDTRTEVFAARSTDGGQTFQNFRLSQSPFTPDETIFFGDYTNITAHNNVVRPVWTRMDNRQTSVWTALINVPVLATPSAAGLPGLSLHTYPNPARHTLNLALQVPLATTATIKLLTPDGRHLRTVVENEPVTAGQRQLSLPVQDLPPGAYLLEAQIGSQRLHRKVIVVR
ncbi:T9SS type A sorting domain-containing protein [Hymenobacter sp. BT186]|uniref:T9SS type A sorting domain-containing protein n=1 Tax=Hymenobacter telluris TaxID=2816474 RepID=A0A939F2X3_9BACT|nr:T9SS type A sorting domain-containing protein [Hymenobacter telluris]MBO0361100.1 T9SS type A sorting domain-containing protein [Hymenobacter telluris]MBW3377128.1 T9SS type A sorting domain-containing protein [Hymenobacter norwichensis]